MAKNRYRIENNIIVAFDGSYTAEEVYETDENLTIGDGNGTKRYKIVDGSHVLRTQEEMDTDYLPIYKEEKLTELRELLYTRWPDSSKTIAALKAQYDVVKAASSEWDSLTDVDTAYDNFTTFMDLS